VRNLIALVCSLVSGLLGSLVATKGPIHKVQERLELLQTTVEALTWHALAAVSPRSRAIRSGVTRARPGPRGRALTSKPCPKRGRSRAEAYTMIATLEHIAFSLMPAGVKWRYIYRRNRRNPARAESASGPGSTLANTENVRQALPNLLRQYCSKSIVDVPYGTSTGCATSWLRPASNAT
jgi:hypothetical protein